MSEKIPQLAVSAAIRHAQTGAFLLVQRGNAPAKGMWAFAGGRVEFGERLVEAAAREFKEETGLECADLASFDYVELIEYAEGSSCPAYHYVLCVHAGTATGTPKAADDAADARWVAWSDFDDLDVTPSTRSIAARLIASPIKQM